MQEVDNSIDVSAFDIVIVGAGIGGGALAVSLAKNDVKVLLLEKSVVHKDVVRGEWLAPWGVREAKKLGLMDLYVSAGGHRPQRHVTYNEFMTTSQAQERTVNFSDLFDAPMCFGHPATCNLLNDAAMQAGVVFLRGVSKLQVRSGYPPTVQFSHDNNAYTVHPRLVVGADGRNGVVAKQIGCQLFHDEEHHLFSGMLVEGAHDWPEELQVIGSEGDANVLAFPQGSGKVRIYLGWPRQDRTRLLGTQGQAKFLESWQLKCIPYADTIVHATPVSRCISYPNFDAWVDSPVREGVVLIGDAAGRNDPIIGQGLSVTHRDVRLVRDALLKSHPWTANIFDYYVAERLKRMARLRTCARLTTLRDSAFGESGRKLRHEIHMRIADNPELEVPFSAAFVGPHNVPAKAFSPEICEAIVGGPLWSSR